MSEISVDVSDNLSQYEPSWSLRSLRLFCFLERTFVNPSLLCVCDELLSCTWFSVSMFAPPVAMIGCKIVVTLLKSFSVGLKAPPGVCMIRLSCKLTDGVQLS